MNDTEYQDRVSAYIAEMQKGIKTNGWMVQGVGAGENEPQFCYTVGLSRFGHPEIIMFGLSFEAMQSFLNEIGEKVRTGERFEPGFVTPTGDNQYELRFVRVLDSSTHLTIANRFYGDPNGPPIEALQLVWPDTEHRYPWEDDYSLPEEAQPLLGKPQ